MSSVTVQETNQTIVIDEGETTQTINITEEAANILEVGVQGPAGVNGADGVDGVDGSGDLYYEATLSGQTDITVTHNLGKYPSITVIDSAGDHIEGDYEYLTINSVRLLFSAGFSGKAIFN